MRVVSAQHRVRVRQRPVLNMVLVWVTLALGYFMGWFLGTSTYAPPLLAREVVWWTVLLFPLLPWWWNRRGMARLDFTLVECPPFHQGTRGHVVVDVGNRGRRAYGELVLSSDKSLPLMALGPGEMQTARIPLPDLARGIHPLPVLRVSSTYPFGLFTSHRMLGSSGSRTTCVVYPALEPEAPAWPVPPPQQPRLARRGDEIVTFRDYHDDDPLSSIDWKLTAKRGEVVVRQFDMPEQPRLILNWYDVAHLPVEQALSRLASWVVRAEQSGVVYALALPEQPLMFGGGAAHQQACLTDLAGFKGSRT